MFIFLELGTGVLYINKTKYSFQILSTAVVQFSSFLVDIVSGLVLQVTYCRKRQYGVAKHCEYIFIPCDATSWKQNPHYHMRYVYYRTFLLIRIILKLHTYYYAKYFRLNNTVELIMRI
jgi:hypothetical protein